MLGALDELGYAFTGCSRAECRARVAGAAGGASDEAWDVLATIPFDSAPKRMTVVARRAARRRRARAVQGRRLDRVRARRRRRPRARGRARGSTPRSASSRATGRARLSRSAT